MKKILSLLVFVFGVILVVPHAFSAELPENPPVIGEVSNVTDFYSHWQPGNFGATRLDDNKFVAAMTSGFGLRAGLKTPVDATDFEVTFDLTYIDPGVVFTTFFGPQGSYISGNGALASIEFLEHQSESGKYLVAINNADGLHHESIDGVVDPEQGDWEDNAWQGFHIIAPDHKIRLAVKESGENVIISLNEHDLTVSASDFYKNFDEELKTNIYYLFGVFNKDNTIQTVTVENVLDTTRRPYYAENGTLDTFKTKLANLEDALLEDLDVIENVQAALEIKDSIDVTSLFEFDRNFFYDRYVSALTTLNNAVSAFGGDLLLAILENDVTKLENSIDDIANSTLALAALDKLEEAKLALADLDTDGYDEDQTDRYDALSTRIDEAELDIFTKIEDLVETQVSTYEDLADDLSSITLLNSALVAKGNVSSNLINLLDNTTKEAFLDRVDAADLLLKATQEFNGFKIDDKAFVVPNDKHVGVTMLDGAGIYAEKDKLDLRNFSMKFSVDSITNQTGGWISFGIMEKTEKFINKETSEVQENKGIFFLIIPIGQGKARVETYIMDLYANRFFDAQIPENITIDITEDIDVKFEVILKEIAGVVDEYFQISVGGVTLQTSITLRSIRTALDDYQGYLNFYGSAANADRPNTVTIKQINGKDATDGNFKTTYVPKPVLDTESVEYELDAETVPFVTYYNRGLDFTVKLGDNVLTSDDYTYTNNQLKLNKDLLNELEEGTYTVELKSVGGDNSFTLTISAPEAPKVDDAGSNNTLLWSILGTVAGLAAVGAVVFVVLKKKKII